jgi:hypothetical protein
MYDSRQKIPLAIYRWTMARKIQLARLALKYVAKFFVVSHVNLQTSIFPQLLDDDVKRHKKRQALRIGICRNRELFAQILILCV